MLFNLQSASILRLIDLPWTVFEIWLEFIVVLSSCNRSQFYTKKKPRININSLCTCILQMHSNLVYTILVNNFNKKKFMWYIGKIFNFLFNAPSVPIPSRNFMALPCLLYLLLDFFTSSWQNRGRWKSVVFKLSDAGPSFVFIKEKRMLSTVYAFLLTLLSSAGVQDVI